MASIIKELTQKILNKEPFAFIKRGDGEEACMRGDEGFNCDGHFYSPSLAALLIEAFSNFEKMENAFIPRFEDQEYYNSLLHRTDNNLGDVKSFYEAIRNDKRKKVFIGPERLGFVNILLNTTSFVAVPLNNCFDSLDEIIFKILTTINNGDDDTIYLFSCGMTAKCIADYLYKNTGEFRNSKAITCIDLGSSFDPLVGQTRTYQISTEEIVELYKECFPTIDIVIPTLGRPEGLKRCVDSIPKIIYPTGKINVIIKEDEPRIGVAKRLNQGFEEGDGDWVVYGSNDIEFTPYSIINALSYSKHYSLISFNTGSILPDKGNICEHFIIEREIVNDVLDGKIFDEDFGHVGVDNLLWRQFDRLGIAIRDDNAAVYHYHFSNGGSKMDEVYELGWKDVDRDREILKDKLDELG
jgi:hypothetical protein